MTGTRQGGSILNFIIVAVVLVGLLAAGIYVVRQVTQGEASSETGGVIAEEEMVEESQLSPEDKTDELAQELPGDVEVSAKELPQTGPVETIGSVLGLGTLSLMVLYYVRSRRIELSL